MIKKFKQYNEGLSDQMTPKSDDDVQKGINSFLIELKRRISDPQTDEDHIMAWEMVNKLLAIEGINEGRDVLNTLIDNDIVNTHQLIQYIQEDIDGEYSGYSTEHKLLSILEILEDNKDKIDPSQL